MLGACRDPLMQGAAFACQSSQGGEGAEMARLLVLGEVHLKSRKHLQFGVWMHVQKQPGYRSSMYCDAGPCTAPLVGTRAHVGSGDEQREAWSYKNLVARGCSPRFGGRRFAEQPKLRARAGAELELCKENWVGARQKKCLLILAEELFFTSSVSWSVH